MAKKQKVFTIAQAADKLGISTNAVRKAIKTGRLVAGPAKGVG